MKLNKMAEESVQKYLKAIPSNGKILESFNE